MHLFQERDFGEKINATFAYTTQNFRSLLPALLYIAGPVALLAGIAEGVFQSELLTGQSPFGSDAPSAGDQISILYKGGFSIFFLSNILKILANLIASLVVYSHLYLYNRNASVFIDAGVIWPEIVSALGRSLWITFVSFWLALLGFVFIIIPGIYIGVVLSLALPVTVFEKSGLSRTISRCFQLISDKWWSTFGLLVIMALIVLVLGFGFSIPAALVNILTALKILPNTPAIVTVLVSAISTVGVTLLSALVALAIGFQYFNLVERQEGTGLLSAIDTIGTSFTRPTAQDEGDY
ncbi:hypothetical protein GCM10023187_48970 [Nibrella viscosa]|uniref:Glycerophosphoryl diester phosphodiesterase membrane domain-containing protein n=1 Tax=Nibrella viscosa TaxID=1084524 RepID=A0ABP8KVC1_9BACT